MTNRWSHNTSKAPSSLVFVGTILGCHTVLSMLWVALPLGTPLRILGLLGILLTLLTAARVWGTKRPAPPSTPTPSQPMVLDSSKLQSFLVQHLRFVVLSIKPDLQFQRETPPWSLAVWGAPENGDFVEWLSSWLPLSDDEQRSIRFQMLHAFGMNEIQWSVCQCSLPREGRTRQNQQAFVRISYIPNFTDSRLQTIHVIIQDVTEIKEREVQAKQQRKELEKLFSLLQVSDSLFELFMGETRKLFDDIKQDLKTLREHKTASSAEIVLRMFRSVHTIKANAKMFKLNSIQEVAHEVETYLQEICTGQRLYSPEILNELTQSIMQISEEVYSYASLRKEILNTADRNHGYHIKYRVQWIRSLMNQFASIIRDPHFEQRHLKIVQKEFSRALSSFDKASLREYIRTYDQMLQELAAQFGKEIEHLQTDLECHYFESHTLARINDIILHCLRNSVDHGIERPEERLKVGKPRRGRITLRTSEQDGMVHIELLDDGRGIDIGRVKAKAVELGLVSAEEVVLLSDSEAVPLLFHAGVSTAAAVTEISGRGLGMDVVRDYVQSLSGQLTVSFVKGTQTRISVLIPAATDDFIAPLAIHDLQDIVTDVVKDYIWGSEGRFEIRSVGNERVRVFSDRSGLAEVLRMVLSETHQRTPVGEKVGVTIEEHMGRRRVDSHSFYRLNIHPVRESLDERKADEHEHRAFEMAAQMIRKSGGSLYVRGPRRIEVNLPSNMPVRFSEYEFRVLIFADRFLGLDQQIQSFFGKVMGGWSYRPYHYPFSHGLPPELEGVPCLVLLDMGLLRTYVDLREEQDRKRDGIVLLPEEDLDIDVLDGTSILPENILFVPPNFDEKHFHRSLAGVIFRRFLKEMVRQAQDASGHNGGNQIGRLVS